MVPRRRCVAWCGIALWYLAVWCRIVCTCEGDSRVWCPRAWTQPSLLSHLFPVLQVGVAISDLMTGVYASVGILAALRQRDTTGWSFIPCAIVHATAISRSCSGHRNRNRTFLRRCSLFIDPHTTTIFPTIFLPQASDSTSIPRCLMYKQRCLRTRWGKHAVRPCACNKTLNANSMGARALLTFAHTFHSHSYHAVGNQLSEQR